MSELSNDFETRSVVDLKKTSVYPYAAHPLTDIWCWAWAFDAEEPEIWRPGLTLPERITQHIIEHGVLRAWNAGFERLIWREIMVKRYGAPAIEDDQWIDTAAEAAAMALPRSLGKCAQVLGVKQQKDDDGHDLMMRMAKPRKPRKNESKDALLWWDDEERRARLEGYCKQDVHTERSVKNALRRLTAKETQIFLLDQRINDRGLPIDMQLVQAAQKIREIGTDRANAQLAELTGGAVAGVTKNADIVDWLVGDGVDTESVAKAKVAEMLERDDLSPTAREVLELRADAGRSSLAKLDAIELVTCEDGRARGLHMYHAASTGRWGGKHIQTQNFPRGTVKGIEGFIPDVLAGNYEIISLIEHPLIVLSSMLRCMIAADDDHDLLAADFSAIEARVLNWVAGQNDVIESFRLYDLADKAHKPFYDPYRRMAVKMGRASSPELVTPIDRQAGKAAELGCGFQMGAEKFVRAAWEVYQVRVDDTEATLAVKAYRSSHEKVVDLWYDVERAVKQACATPGAVFTFGDQGRLKAIVAGSYLYIVLPSGRPLVYAAPRILDAETSWGAIKPTIHYMGIDPHPMAHGRWGVLRTYGGHLIENVVQAIARDLLAEAMLRLEAAGYPIVTHCHDEAVAEVLKGFGDLKAYEALMAETPEWAKGCPVAAEGWRGKRYRK